MRTFLPKCFVLVWSLLGSFTAMEALAQESATWAFTPKPDTFEATALLDLRYLNEKVAGESGFVSTDKSGQFRLIVHVLRLLHPIVSRPRRWRR